MIYRRIYNFPGIFRCNVWLALKRKTTIMKKITTTLLLFTGILTFGWGQTHTPPKEAFQTYQIKLYDEWDRQYQSDIGTMHKVMIEDALHQKLESYGLQQSEQPDAYIVYTVEVNVEKSYNNNYGMYPYRRGYYDPFNNPYYNRYNERPGYNERKDRKLFIEMIDAGTHKIVWYGAEKQPVKKSPDKAQKKIRKTVEKVFEDFPFREPSPEVTSNKQ